LPAGIVSTNMEPEQINATTTIESSPDAVFEVLADPASHAAIDGTGWVRESLDATPLTEAGQVFRIAMYHDNHPDKHYEMANKVVVFDPPHAIAWQRVRCLRRPASWSSVVGCGVMTLRRLARHGPP